MKKSMSLVLIVVLLFMQIGAVPGFSESVVHEITSEEVVEEVVEESSENSGEEKVEYIIKYKGEKNKAIVKEKIKNEKKAKKFKPLKKFDIIEAELVEVDGNEDIESVLNQYIEEGLIEYYQPNYILETFEGLDEQINKQWYLFNHESNEGTANGIDLKILESWSLTTGNENILIGVLDSGVDIYHEDLQNAIYVNVNEIPNNNIDDDNNGYIDDINGWDFVGNDNSVYDSPLVDKHGTHIAGIIGAEHNAIGIRGITPDAKILPLKFINGTTGYTSDAIEAIEYAKGLGVTIVNCSWGGSHYNSALFETIENSEMLFVCAAGNNSADLSVENVYPAEYNLNNIISVGSCGMKGQLSEFSNYGGIDILAPGESIYSTLPNNSYDNMNGTSMATPIITGLAALLSGRDETINNADVIKRIMVNIDSVESGNVPIVNFLDSIVTEKDELPDLEDYISDVLSQIIENAEEEIVDEIDDDNAEKLDPKEEPLEYMIDMKGSGLLEKINKIKESKKEFSGSVELVENEITRSGNEEILIGYKYNTPVIPQVEISFYDSKKNLIDVISYDNQGTRSNGGDFIVPILEGAQKISYSIGYVDNDELIQLFNTEKTVNIESIKNDAENIEMLMEKYSKHYEMDVNALAYDSIDTAKKIYYNYAANHPDYSVIYQDSVEFTWKTFYSSTPFPDPPTGVLQQKQWRYFYTPSQGIYDIYLDSDNKIEIYDGNQNLVGSGNGKITVELEERANYYVVVYQNYYTLASAAYTSTWCDIHQTNHYYSTNMYEFDALSGVFDLFVERQIDYEEVEIGGEYSGTFTGLNEGCYFLIDLDKVEGFNGIRFEQSDRLHYSSWIYTQGCKVTDSGSFSYPTPSYIANRRTEYKVMKGGKALFYTMPYNSGSPVDLDYNLKIGTFEYDEYDLYMVDGVYKGNRFYPYDITDLVQQGDTISAVYETKGSYDNDRYKFYLSDPGVLDLSFKNNDLSSELNVTLYKTSDTGSYVYPSIGSQNCGGNETVRLMNNLTESGWYMVVVRWVRGVDDKTGYELKVQRKDFLEIEKRIALDTEGVQKLFVDIYGNNVGAVKNAAIGIRYDSAQINNPVSDAGKLLKHKIGLKTILKKNIVGTNLNTAVYYYDMEDDFSGDFSDQRVLLDTVQFELVQNLTADQYNTILVADSYITNYDSEKTSLSDYMASVSEYGGNEDVTSVSYDVFYDNIEARIVDEEVKRKERNAVVVFDDMKYVNEDRTLDIASGELVDSNSLLALAGQIRIPIGSVVKPSEITVYLYAYDEYQLGQQIFRTAQINDAGRFKIQNLPKNKKYLFDLEYSGTLTTVGFEKEIRKTAQKVIQPVAEDMTIFIQDCGYYYVFDWNGNGVNNDTEDATKYFEMLVNKMTSAGDDVEKGNTHYSTEGDDLYLTDSSMNVDGDDENTDVSDLSDTISASAWFDNPDSVNPDINYYVAEPIKHIDTLVLNSKYGDEGIPEAVAVGDSGSFYISFRDTTDNGEGITEDWLCKLIFPESYYRLLRADTNKLVDTSNYEFVGSEAESDDTFIVTFRVNYTVDFDLNDSNFDYDNEISFRLATHHSLKEIGYSGSEYKVNLPLEWFVIDGHNKVYDNGLSFNKIYIAANLKNDNVTLVPEKTIAIIQTVEGYNFICEYKGNNDWDIKGSKLASFNAPDAISSEINGFIKKNYPTMQWDYDVESDMIAYAVDVWFAKEYYGVKEEFRKEFVRGFSYGFDQDIFFGIPQALGRFLGKDKRENTFFFEFGEMHGHIWARLFFEAVEFFVSEVNPTLSSFEGRFGLQDLDYYIGDSFPNKVNQTNGSLAEVLWLGTEFAMTDSVSNSVRSLIPFMQAREDVAEGNFGSIKAKLDAKYPTMENLMSDYADLFNMFGEIDQSRFDTFLNKIRDGYYEESALEALVINLNEYMNDSQKGFLGEAISDIYQQRSNPDFEWMESRLSSNHGFDGLYFKYRKDVFGNYLLDHGYKIIDEVHIVEAKYGTKYLRIYRGDKQLSDGWIVEVIDDMIDYEGTDERLLKVKENGELLEVFFAANKNKVLKYRDWINRDTGVLLRSEH